MPFSQPCFYFNFHFFHLLFLFYTFSSDCPTFVIVVFLLETKSSLKLFFLSSGLLLLKLKSGPIDVFDNKHTWTGECFKRNNMYCPGRNFEKELIYPSWNLRMICFNLNDGIQYYTYPLGIVWMCFVLFLGT